MTAATELPVSAIVALHDAAAKLARLDLAPATAFRVLALQRATKPTYDDYMTSLRSCARRHCERDAAGNPITEPSPQGSTYRLSPAAFDFLQSEIADLGAVTVALPALPTFTAGDFPAHVKVSAETLGQLGACLVDHAA